MNELASHTDAQVLKIRENLWGGLERYFESFEAGTHNEKKDEKSCSPLEFAAVLTMPLFLKWNEECVRRGFSDYTERLW